MVNFGITQQKKQELARRMHKCNLLENKLLGKESPEAKKIEKIAEAERQKKAGSPLIPASASVSPSSPSSASFPSLPFLSWV